MEKILIAKISKPQGIKGELKCQLFTDILAVFNGEISDFYVSNKLMKAEKVSVRQGSLYIKFEDINTRAEAEGFRNKEIALPKEVLKQYLEDEILVDDLIGMILCDETGNVIGQIVDFENYGASDILTVLENGHEYQIPFVTSIFKQQGQSVVADRKAYNENKI